MSASQRIPGGGTVDEQPDRARGDGAEAGETGHNRTHDVDQVGTHL
jgi:hypothetical protein